MALGLSLEPLEDLPTWTGELEARLPESIPFARLAVCWQAADLWRAEAVEGALDPIVFALQEELYEPSPEHRRELLRASAALPWLSRVGPTFRLGALRARSAKSMLHLTRSSAGALLNTKSPPHRRMLTGFLYPEQCSFAGFVSACLGVFETEQVVGWLADAIGERLLYEGGSFEPIQDPESDPDPG